MATVLKLVSFSSSFLIDLSVETINFLVSDDSMLLIPPTDSNIILSSNGLHLKLPGIYYIYCQVSIGAPANEVDVSLVQDAIAVATGLSGSVNFPKTVFLGRLICVRNRRGSYINVKVKSLKPATIWLNGRNTYVGAFLVGPLSGTMNNSNHCVSAVTTELFLCSNYTAFLFSCSRLNHIKSTKIVKSTTVVKYYVYI